MGCIRDRIAKWARFFTSMCFNTLCLVGISAPLVRELSISTSVQLQLATFCFLWCGQNWEKEVKYLDWLEMECTHQITMGCIRDRIMKRDCRFMSMDFNTLCLVGIPSPLIIELSISTLSMQLQLATFCILRLRQSWEKRLNWSNWFSSLIFFPRIISKLKVSCIKCFHTARRGRSHQNERHLLLSLLYLDFIPQEFRNYEFIAR